MIDEELLSVIQKKFPITKRPFLEIGNRLSIDEDEAILLFKKFKDEKIIRQTSGIFDTKRLGYNSSLIAFKVDNIEENAKIISEHPGVSHNYERDAEFNLWFTIATPPDSIYGLDGSVKLLAKKTNCSEYMILPTIKMFKISVLLDTTGKREKKEKIVAKELVNIELTNKHYKVIELLQDDLEVVKEPFESIVKKLNISYDELSMLVDDLEIGGYMRRYASILNHRKAGFGANGMAVWCVEDDKCEEVGNSLASFSAVSHCYLRPTFENWPYNIFTMVHGKTKEETNSIIADMSKDVGVDKYKIIYSTKEFKKQRIKYFTQDVYSWEAKQ